MKRNVHSLNPDMTNLGTGPVTATMDLRRVGLTDGPGVLAVRFFFENSERLVRLSEPTKSTLKDLREALAFTAALEPGKPISHPPVLGLQATVVMEFGPPTGSEVSHERVKHGDGSSDKVNDLWKATQCLQFVIFGLLNSGALALTPTSRPLIQLTIELQDLLFGRRNGSLLAARKALSQARRYRGGSDRPLEEMPASVSSAATSPFQRLVGALARNTDGIDEEDDATWLRSCSQSLDSTLTYLKGHRFSIRTLSPLQKLADALHIELNGLKSHLFEDHLSEYRHGPELSASKPPRLNRHFFERLLVHAMERFREIRPTAALEMGWFEQQLQILDLKDEIGASITAETVRRYVKRQNDPPKRGSGWANYRSASDYVMKTFLSGFALLRRRSGSEQLPKLSFEWKEDNKPLPIQELPPQVQVQVLLQTAMLYQPRYQSRRAVQARCLKT